MINLIGFTLMLIFVALFIRRPPAPIEEEEFSSDDNYYFRITQEGVEAGALARED